MDGAIQKMKQSEMMRRIAVQENLFKYEDAARLLPGELRKVLESHDLLPKEMQRSKRFVEYEQFPQEAQQPELAPDTEYIDEENEPEPTIEQLSKSSESYHEDIPDDFDTKLNNSIPQVVPENNYDQNIEVEEQTSESSMKPQESAEVVEDKQKEPVSTSSSVTVKYSSPEQRKQFSQLIKDVTGMPDSSSLSSHKPKMTKRNRIPTKTLAELYASQEKWELAVEVYEELIIRHPESQSNKDYLQRIEDLKMKMKG